MQEENDLSKNSEKVIYTIGHSVKELETFISLLITHRITVIVDVRSQPFSRKPHFNRTSLEAALKLRGIKYIFKGKELGARRDERDCYINDHVDYKLVAGLPLFQEGINWLLKNAGTDTIAIMCAEKEPLDCHRTLLICRNLRGSGLLIRHILSNGNVEEHKKTERRLVEIMKLAPNLFKQDITHADLIEEAYDARSKEIAFHVGDMKNSVLAENNNAILSKSITIYTIGFARKTAEEFFDKLQNAGVKRLIDIRLNNVSQLAGFTKKRDLEFFLRVIANIKYVHMKELAPTAEMLKAFKSKKQMDWLEFERKFMLLLKERPLNHLRQKDFDKACLLCSEAKSQHCHRRLVAEYLHDIWDNVSTIHL